MARRTYNDRFQMDDPLEAASKTTKWRLKKRNEEMAEFSSETSEVAQLCGDREVDSNDLDHIVWLRYLYYI